MSNSSVLVIVSGTAVVLASACVRPQPYTVTQRGMVAAPRAATLDARPMTGAYRVEGHASTATIQPGADQPESGAAVARNQAGGAVRRRISERSDVGIEVDAAWNATDRTLGGDTAELVPHAAAIDTAVALRSAWPLTDRVRLGVALAGGVHSSPIRRDDASPGRDQSLLFRAAIGPSYQLGAVSLFAAVGMATETDVPGNMVISSNASGTGYADPGLVAETAGVAATLAAGASVSLGERALLTARLSHVTGTLADYGPQVDVGLAMDVGD